MQPLAARRKSFIVRLTAEAEGGGISQRWIWRGEVESTFTGQSWRFATLQELSRILEALLQDLPDEDDFSAGRPHG